MNDAADDAFALDDFMPYRVNVLASRISAALASVYADRFGITIPEWRVIAHLSGAQKVSVREIHWRVDMDKSKVSRAAARLEEAGLIAKRVNRGDRRLVELSLTRKGQRLFAQIAPLALGFERDWLAHLEPAERTALSAIVNKLIDATAQAQPDGDQ